MIALLAIGFVANELIRPVDPRHYVPESERGGVEDAGVSWPDRNQEVSR